MILKCLKYDAISQYRMIWPLYLGVVLMGLGKQLCEFLSSHWELFQNFLVQILFGIYDMLFYIGLLALFLWPIVVFIRNYFNSMLKDEGYLTQTLPVSKHVLILSKEVVALSSILVSGVLFYFLALVVDLQVQTNMPDRLDVLFCFGFVLVSSLMVAISQIVLSMMLGQMHRSAKGIISFAYYIVLYLIMQIINLSALAIVGTQLELGSFGSYILENQWDFFRNLGIMLGGYYIVVSIVFHLLSVWICKNKLNLE